MRNVPVDKLRIKVKEFATNPVDAELEYVAMINPSSYSINSSTSFNVDSQSADTGAMLRFDRMLPASLSITLLFDSTGSLGAETLNVAGIKPELDRFMKVAYSLGSDSPQTNVLEILWGTLVYTCKLESVNLTFTKFDFNGNPCRGTAVCVFKHHLTEKDKETFKAGASGTKKRKIKLGDTLDKISLAATGAAGAYLAVAQANKLKSLRGPKSVPDSNELIIPSLPKLI